MFRPLAWTKTLALIFLVTAFDHSGTGFDASLPARQVAAGIEEPGGPHQQDSLFADSEMVPAATGKSFSR